ncbi:protein lethal(2)essential for life-like [Diorhabda carinulata]|uniref:protein lethal(2)essential for life-like n=1 Tax=Diorhabda sublineata TaxID=1163346 RepID=UPI0024E0F222|nr:protein lethal(2)essential for life-like [Diorhabda sublineata]XP_057657204.1 protein lethal(2)essential for life-like [Diorhabda carinulata]
MSLIPYLFDDSYFARPSRIFDQHFGMVLEPEDLFQPVSRHFLRCPAGYIRNWKSAASEHDSGSVVNYGKDQFLANLDVQQFKPDEISVKVTGENTITIEGKHEEKEDEHGHIYRHFLRKYVVPKTYDMSKLESKLSSDGVLSITAPRIDAGQITHKVIPVEQTGQPAKAIEKESGAGDKK